ncbi:hypothetical protein CLF_113573 [Clonorchis sinensis]|uniref:Uncharacterized protein n=1 Tax=Clonorchis sinensis TaxID=79923 RepID=G7YMW2_CLOSI|nr:hypothetical protein CLF_113573 [Clonorchis sinensis]
MPKNELLALLFEVSGEKQASSKNFLNIRSSGKKLAGFNNVRLLSMSVKPTKISVFILRTTMKYRKNNQTGWLEKEFALNAGNIVRMQPKKISSLVFQLNDVTDSVANSHAEDFQMNRILRK